MVTPNCADIESAIDTIAGASDPVRKPQVEGRGMSLRTYHYAGTAICDMQLFPFATETAVRALSSSAG